MATEGEYMPPLVTKLIADTSDLLAGFAEAKAAKEQFERDMSETDATLRKTGAEASKTGDALAEMGVEAERTSTKTTKASRTAREEIKRTDDALSASMRRFRSDTKEAERANADFTRLVVNNMKLGETAVSSLRREHGRLTHELREAKKLLGGSFSTKADYGRVTDIKRNLGKLADIGKDLGIDLGTQVSKSFVSQLGNASGAALTALGPVGAAIGAAIVTAIILATPVIGSAIAAAVTIGLGAGVIGLGAYILKDDKQIKKAAEKLAKTTSTIFEKAAQPLKKPFIKALGFIESEFKKLEGPLHDLFAAAAPLVQPLAEGLMGALKNALPGITQALINAKPVFDTLAETMPIIGMAFGQFFADISKNGPELQLFLSDAMLMVAGLILYLGEFIGWLAKAYAKMRGWAKAVKDGLQSVTDTIRDWYHRTIGWIYDMAVAIGDALGLGISDGVNRKAGQVGAAAAAMAGGAIAAAAAKLKVKSPSRVGIYLGEMFGEGAALGIMRSTDRVVAAAADMVALGRRQRAGLGYDAALALSRPAAPVQVQGGGGQPIILTMDGRVVARGLVPYGQRAANRNGGVSGLGNVAVV